VLLHVEIEALYNDGNGRTYADPGLPAIAASLAAYYKLEEASGTRYDAHGANHLTDVNTVASTTGKLGNAASLVAASGEYFSVASNDQLRAADVAFTLSAWVYPTTLAGLHRSIVSKHDNASYAGSEYYLHWDKDVAAGAGRFRVYVVSSTLTYQAMLTADTFGVVATGAWYFVVTWHDPVANTVNIQINNGTVDSMAMADPSHTSTTPLRIGATGGGGQFWDGLIDEVGLWRRVLSAAERTQLYNAGAGVTYPTFTTPVTKPYYTTIWRRRVAA
jgi:hypothetical protein